MISFWILRIIFSNCWMFSGKPLLSMSLFSPPTAADLAMAAPDSDTLTPSTKVGVAVFDKSSSWLIAASVWVISGAAATPLLPGPSVPMAVIGAFRGWMLIAVYRPQVLRLYVCGTTPPRAGLNVLA